MPRLKQSITWCRGLLYYHSQVALLLIICLVIGCSSSHHNTTHDAVISQLNSSTPENNSAARPGDTNSNDSVLPQGPIIPIPPDRDPVALASRYSGKTILPEDHAFSDREVYNGMVRNIWVVDVNGPSVSTIDVELKYMGKWADWYFDTTVNFDHDDIVAVANFFDDSIYPHIKETFASSKGPMPKIAVINAPLNRVAGYFSPPDNLPISVNPFSNQLFNIMVDPKVGITSNTYIGTITHEYFHAVQWLADPTEETWVNEGLAELSAVLAGLPTIPSRFYLESQDISLINWLDSPQDALAHYAGASLFMQYLAKVTGVQNMGLLVNGQADGTEAIEHYLDVVLPGNTFPEIYADWLAENVMNTDHIRGDKDMVNKHVINDSVTAEIHHGTGTVNQFGAWHLEFTSENEFLVELSGDPTTPMIPSEPDNNGPYWWSNRGDNINSTLTRPIELSTVSNPILLVNMWYDIETDWDFGYISVSNDGGKSWEPLDGKFTTSKNPIGKSYGPAYTGTSGGWITEKIDLSAFAGENILLRFEYVTDEAVNQSGWYINDIRIHAIGVSNLTSDLSKWTSEGFAYLPTLDIDQEYALRLIQDEGTLSTVSRIHMDDKNMARFRVTGPAILVATGTNTYTSDPGKIRYVATPIR
jgi:immune inhibitor A